MCCCLLKPHLWGAHHSLQHLQSLLRPGVLPPVTVTESRIFPTSFRAVTSRVQSSGCPSALAHELFPWPSGRAVNPHYLWIPICKRAYPLECMCHPKSTPRAFAAVHGPAQNAEMPEWPRPPSLAEAEQGTVCLLAPVLILHTGVLAVLRGAPCSSLAHLLLKMTPACGAEVSSSASEGQEAAMCPTEKTRV